MNTRPTAYNLFWAINKMLSKIGIAKSELEIEKILLNTRRNDCKNDIEQCKK